MELLPDFAALYLNGVFVLEADDGYAGHLANVVPIVTARGIPVTMNPIIDRFIGGTPASGMTVADLQTFHSKYGWQISNHAYSSAAHNTLNTPAVMEADFQLSKQWLRANGLHAGVDDFAQCPGTGATLSEGAMMAAIRKHYRSARTSANFYETVIPSNPLNLASVLFTGNSNAQLQSNIDAMAGPGGVSS